MKRTLVRPSSWCSTTCSPICLPFSEMIRNLVLLAACAGTLNAAATATEAARARVVGSAGSLFIISSPGSFFGLRFLVLVCGPVAAYRAGCIAVDADAAPFHAQAVEHQQPPGLRRADHADQRREHAYGRAGDVFEVLVLREQTGVARRGAGARVEHADLTVEADHGTRHQGLAVLDASAVDGVARGEVVGAVEHHVGRLHQRRQARVVGALDQRGDFDVGIDVQQRGARRFSFRYADTFRGVGDLALQIGQVDRVVVDQRDVADAGRRQVQRGRRTEAAGADDQRMPGQQFLLPFDADFVEQDVARVAQQLVIVHRARRPVLGSAYFFSGAFLSSGLTSVFRSGLTSDLTSVFSTMAESAKAPSALASCTGKPLKWFSACVSWKSSFEPNSTGFCFLASASKRCSSSSPSCLGALTGSALSSSLPRCFCRSASRTRRLFKPSPSAVSSTSRSGTMPRAWMERPCGV